MNDDALFLVAFFVTTLVSGFVGVPETDRQAADTVISLPASDEGRPLGVGANGCHAAAPLLRSARPTRNPALQAAAADG